MSTLNQWKERLLITGGSGLLGSNLARVVAADFNTFATYNMRPVQLPGCELVLLDIRDKQQVLSTFEEIEPALVIHAAALVNVDYCEDHEEEARLINVAGTENVALAAKRIGARLIYISTDSVFDGEKGMYTEDDAAHPINVYARTKLEGEKMVQQHLPDGIIVRTAFYGWSPVSRGGDSLAEWVVRSLREGKTIKMFPDVFFSPIYTDNLAQVLVEMYQKRLSGTYHVGGRERCSKFAFGQAIAAVFGLNKENIKLSSIAEAEFRAPRPKDISLDVSKMSGAVDTRLLDVREGIAWFKDTEKCAQGD